MLQSPKTSPTAPDMRLRLATDALLGRGRLAVIYAGDRDEKGAVLRVGNGLRPWKSYKAVALDIAAALGRLGAHAVEVIPEDMNLPERLERARVDFAWLNTAGVQGAASAGHAAATLEMLGVPYVGHDPLTAATLDDKAHFKRHLVALGIPTAPFLTWHPDNGPFHPDSAAFRQAFGQRDNGFVIKPVNGRASLHVVHVASRADLAAALFQTFEQTRNRLLIEPYLPGREYCAAVCGPTVRRDGELVNAGAPFVFSCVERVLDSSEAIFTSMDQRPITPDRIRLLDARDGPVLTRLEALARRIYRELPLETLVRLDVRADADGALHVLEANPKPDLKAPQQGVTSIVAEGLRASGLAYDDLIYTLLAGGVARHASRELPTARGQALDGAQERRRSG